LDPAISPRENADAKEDLLSVLRPARDEASARLPLVAFVGLTHIHSVPGCCKTIRLIQK